MPLRRNKTSGLKLRAILPSRACTQKGLAQETGLSEPRVSRLVKGSPMTEEEARKIARALSIDIDQLRNPFLNLPRNEQLAKGLLRFHTERLTGTQGEVEAEMEYLRMKRAINLIEGE